MPLSRGPGFMFFRNLIQVKITDLDFGSQNALEIARPLFPFVAPWEDERGRGPGFPLSCIRERRLGTGSRLCTRSAKVPKDLTTACQQLADCLTVLTTV